MSLLATVLGALVVIGGAGTAQAAGEKVTGRLVNAGEPVAGVHITVSQGGSDVGKATTGVDGRWTVELPNGAGEYKVTVDTASFPKGVNLRDPKSNSLTVNVFDGQAHAVLFPLGKDTRQVQGKFSLFLQLLFGGIRYGLVIGLAALGLSMIFGTTGLTNFAHSELITFGALAAYFFNVFMGLNFLVAAVIAVVVSGAFGALLDYGLWRQLRRRGTGLIAQLVVSIGLSLLLRYLYLFFFGGRTRPYGSFQAQSGMAVGPITVTARDLWVIAICILVIVGVSLALQRTRFGKATRAVADNPSLAASSGINVEQVILVVWVVGTALAGLAGIMQALTEQVSWMTGFQLLLLIFAGVTLGGLGTAYGALVGSLVVGIFIEVSTLVIPTELKNLGALVILILVLMVRPQGILGRKERVG